MSSRTGMESGRKRKPGSGRGNGEKTSYKRVTYTVECKRCGKWEEPEGEDSRRAIRDWKDRDFLCMACRVKLLEETLRECMRTPTSTGKKTTNQTTQTQMEYADEPEQKQEDVQDQGTTVRRKEIDLWNQEEVLAITHRRTVTIAGKRFQSLVQYLLYGRAMDSKRDRRVAVKYLQNKQHPEEWIEEARRMDRPARWEEKRREMVKKYIGKMVDQHAEVRSRLQEVDRVEWVGEDNLWRMDYEPQVRIVSEEYERQCKEIRRMEGISNKKPTREEKESSMEEVKDNMVQEKSKVTGTPEIETPSDDEWMEEIDEWMVVDEIREQDQQKEEREPTVTASESTQEEPEWIIVDDIDNATSEGRVLVERPPRKNLLALGDSILKAYGFKLNVENGHI